MNTDHPRRRVRPSRELPTGLLRRSSLIIASTAGGKTELLTTLARRVVAEKAGVVWWMAVLANSPDVAIADYSADLATVGQAEKMVAAAERIIARRVADGHVAQGYAIDVRPVRPDLYLLFDGDGDLAAHHDSRLAALMRTGAQVGVYVATASQPFVDTKTMRAAATAHVLGRVAGGRGPQVYTALFGHDCPDDWRNPNTAGEFYARLVADPEEAAIIRYTPPWPMPMTLAAEDVEAAGPVYDGRSKDTTAQEAA